MSNFTQFVITAPESNEDTTVLTLIQGEGVGVFGQVIVQVNIEAGTPDARLYLIVHIYKDGGSYDHVIVFNKCHLL